MIFIDESGIHKKDGHSTFILVYIIVKDKEEVEKEILAIERFHKIKFFHWSDLPWKLRSAFIKDVSKLSFSAKVAILKNPINPTNALMWSLLHLLTEKNFKAIFIDGKKPRWVENKLKKILRDKGISVKKLKTVRAKSSPCVRLADAFAGLIRSYYDNPNGKAKPLWHLVNKKITTQVMGGQAKRIV